MTAGEQRSVTLGDNTGEPYDLRRKLAYDAIRVSAVPQTPTMPGEEEMPVVGDPTTPDDPADPQDPVVSLDPPGQDTTTDPGQMPGQTEQISVDSGCSGTGMGASWWFLMAAFFRRRRN